MAGKRGKPVITIKLTAEELLSGFGIKLDAKDGISVIVPNVTDGPLTVCKDLNTCTVPAEIASQYRGIDILPAVTKTRSPAVRKQTTRTRTRKRTTKKKK